MQNERYIGIMTGTSIDAVDVVIARFDAKPEVLSFYEHPIPADLRRIILEFATAPTVDLDLLTRTHFVLAELYAVAVRSALKKASLNESDIKAIGLHGQTIRHLPKRKKIVSGLPEVGGTFQLGSGSALAPLVGIDVVSDFRSADMALGGEGAPFVPMFDSRFLRSDSVARIILNMGGIANVTHLPPKSDEVIAFDTGPGNMLIDIIAKKEFGENFDKNGEHARQGKIDERRLAEMLEESYFNILPPKSTGREMFGEAFIEQHTQNLSPNDAISTLTELTALSIANAIKFLPKHDKYEVIASGGGVRNTYLMERIAKNTPNATIHISDEYGIPSQSKEALAFAWFAKCFIYDEIIHLPKTTGAKKTVMLGSLSKGRK